MGKVIQFPTARIRQRGRPAAGVFAAFGELQLVERAQARLFAACAGAALLAVVALQLATG
jgi:hypothetical protein